LECSANSVRYYLNLGFNSKKLTEIVLRQVQIVRHSLLKEISRSKVIVVETAVVLSFFWQISAVNLEFKHK